MAKLCAGDLITQDFHKVKSDTLVPHCITNTLYVVFQSEPAVTGRVHSEKNQAWPIGIISSSEIHVRKGMIFADLIDSAPPPVIDHNTELHEVLRYLLTKSYRYLSVHDSVGNLLGIITPDGLCNIVSDYISQESGQKDIFIRAIEQAADPVMITNKDGIIQYANKAFELISGYARKEILGKKPDILKSGKHEDAFFSEMWNTLVSGKSFSDRFINRRKDGVVYYEEKTISPVRNNSGRISHYIATSRDITSRARYEERLEFLAYYDPLTSLPNRLLFSEKLDQAIESAQLNHAKLAVLFIMLDRFKIIIETLGNKSGDELLCLIARKFTYLLRSVDTIARMGGNEFAIILKDVDSPKAIMQQVYKFQNIFNESFVIKAHEISITASMGITIYPWDGEDTKTLCKNGDTAMNLARELGGNGFQFYSKKMSVESEKRLKLETSMRRAIERTDEFILFYQPQINLYSGEIISVEALIRWKHPELGMISPLEFIPMAEETGLIEPLSALILREACLQTKRWNASGNCKIRTAINISGKQFKKPDFHDFFINTSQASNLPLEHLEIEITESCLVGNDEHIITTLESLRYKGISIAIDDFGTGYSSLGYLKRLPIDVLKIDRTFVNDITSDPDDASIVYAITTMAHNLGIKAVAEGVETKEQLAFLRACKCDFAQGYYLGRPMRAEDMNHYLQVFGMQSKPRQRGRSLRATV